MPNKVEHLFQAQLFHDRKQREARSRMSDADLSRTHVVDYLRPIIADADTGHGGLTDRFDCQFLMGLFSYVYYSSLIRESRISVQMVMQMIITQLPIEEQKQLLYNLTSYLADEN